MTTEQFIAVGYWTNMLLQFTILSQTKINITRKYKHYMPNISELTQSNTQCIRVLKNIEGHPIFLHYFFCFRLSVFLQTCQCSSKNLADFVSYWRAPWRSSYWTVQCKVQAPAHTCKSPGPDQIPNWLLWDFCVWLTKPVCCIIYLPHLGQESSLRCGSSPTSVLFLRYNHLATSNLTYA